MSLERRIKIIQTGGEQSIPVPREFALPTEDALIRKDGDKLVIEPAARPSLLKVLAGLRPIGEDFPPIEELAPEPIDL